MAKQIKLNAKIQLAKYILVVNLTGITSWLKGCKFDYEILHQKIGVCVVVVGLVIKQPFCSMQVKIDNIKKMKESSFEKPNILEKSKS